MGLGRSAEGCARRDRADRCGPQEPNAGIAERGYDADQVDGEIAADKEREKQLGLIFGSAALPAGGQTIGEAQAASDAEAA